MSNNIAGSEIHDSPRFAQTEITALGLPLDLHNELQIRVDKVLTAASQEERALALTYAQGLVRGMVNADALKAAQALALRPFWRLLQLKAVTNSTSFRIIPGEKNRL
jgi:hypothetical protein